MEKILMNSSIIKTRLMVSQEQVKIHGAEKAIKLKVDSIAHDVRPWFTYLWYSGVIQGFRKHSSTYDQSRFDTVYSTYEITWELPPKKQIYFFFKYSDEYSKHSNRRFA